MSLGLSHKYTEKKHHLKTFKDKALIKEIFDIFANKDPKDYTLKQISEESNIPYGTIQYWHSKWKRDHEFSPGATFGQHKRLFSKNQEIQVADLIRTQYLQHHIMIRRKHLRRILFSCWQSYDLPNRQHILMKNIISYHFMKKFCERNMFSFRQMRKKKRSEIKQEEVDAFTKELTEVIEKYGVDGVINMDETPWCFVYAHGKVLAQRGTEEVEAQLPDDFRRQMTVIATIKANGEKLPPLFLAKGTTNKCHQQFDGIKSKEKYEIYHSPSGKTDEEVMCFYLNKLHQWMREKQCALVLDRFAAHICDSTLEEARKLDIRLVFVPTSATEYYQPLDRRVFGALKSAASSSYADFAFAEQKAYTNNEAADLFLRQWYRLSHHLIRSAWRVIDSIALEEESSSDSEESDGDVLESDDHEFSDEDYSDSDEYSACASRSMRRTGFGRPSMQREWRREVRARRRKRRHEYESSSSSESD